MVAHERAIAEQSDRCWGDVLVSGKIEVVEGFDAGQAGFVNAACAASFVADIELDLERFGEERGV